MAKPPSVERLILRDCMDYRLEYDVCINDAKQQRFGHGEVFPCGHWMKFFELCRDFHANPRDERVVAALEPVFIFENELFNERRRKAAENDVWEYRDEPPENWNAWLPDNFYNSNNKGATDVMLAKIKDTPSLVDDLNMKMSVEFEKESKSMTRAKVVSKPHYDWMPWSEQISVWWNNIFS